MKRALPAYCYAKRGAVYFFRRSDGKWRKMQSAPNTPEFAREYALLLADRAPITPTGKTFAALIASYRQSPEFRRLKPRTRADYERVLAWAEAKMGDKPADRFQAVHAYRAQASNPGRFGNYIVQVLRVLFGHAVKIGLRPDNPVKGVSLVKLDTPPREPWPAAKVAQFREAAPIGTRARLIFELLLGTGQRIGDALRMRWNDLSDGGINVRQGKTGARLWVPLTRDLQAVLEVTPRKGLTILAQADGKPLRYRSAADDVMAVRVLIGAERWDLHSLRYSAAAELARLGCTDEQIASITGHSSLAMVRKYAGEARQIARAKQVKGIRG